MNKSRLALVLAIAALAAAFFAFGGHRYLAFESIKAQQAAILELCGDRRRVQATPVHEFVDLFVI